MAAARDFDLTTGPISGHFRRLAIPAALGMLFTTLYNVVDVYFAGQIGTQAQAGLAIGFQAFFILVAVAFGLSSAMSALVGNARGAKDDRMARRLAVQGLAFATTATIALMIFAVWFGPRAIALISEPGEYRDAATGYFYWLIAALPGFILAFPRTVFCRRMAIASRCNAVRWSRSSPISRLILSLSTVSRA